MLCVIQSHHCAAGAHRDALVQHSRFYPASSAVHALALALVRDVAQDASAALVLLDAGALQVVLTVLWRVCIMRGQLY